jgi:signal transduction histidine kinase/CheY-like chemotaxis protein/ligand-binding sensor domain-containing protein/AraC-like DNA-binding protein
MTKHTQRNTLNLGVLCAILSLLFLSTSTNCLAYTMRRITNTDGLSNSAILSLCLASDGALWVGTCDGVNIYDGTSIQRPLNTFADQRLAGNIIEHLTEAPEGIMWVQTNYGINRINTISGQSTHFPQFQGQEILRKTQSNAVYVLAENDSLYRYAAETNRFEVMGKSSFSVKEVFDMAVYGNALRLFTKSGVFSYTITPNRQLGELTCINPDRLLFSATDGSTTLVVDELGQLAEYRPADYRPVELVDISSELKERGDIAAIMRNRLGDIFVAFRTAGVIKASHAPGSNRYVIEDIGIRSGIFCLERSTAQDIIWIGSDCQGIYAYAEGHHTIRTISYADWGKAITHPIRSLLLDKEGTLWVGTKGDGLLRIDRFDETQGLTAASRKLYTSSDSELRHNSVFALSAGQGPILWIATEEGLCYYSYKDRRIHAVNSPEGARAVYAVRQDADTLFFASVGYGVFRATVGGSPDKPVLKDVRQYTIDGGNYSSNYFFAMTRGDDGTLYVGNRGRGVFRLDNDTLTPIPLRGNYATQTVCDVFSVRQDRHALWLGTGHGLIKATPDAEHHFAGSDKGIFNNTIHALASDSDGELWLSTNNGLIRFSPETEQAHHYGSNYGITVSEFSDGAVFAAPDKLLFGGIDGLTLISPVSNYFTYGKFAPRISLRRLNIAGSEASLFEHMTPRSSADEVPTILLESHENYMSLGFTAPDFINSASYTWRYSLDNQPWVGNGASSVISFTDLSYGKHELEVCYVNRKTGVESEPYKVNIIVRSPWPLTPWAKAVYAAVVLLIGLAAVRFYLRRREERQQQTLTKLEQAHKEELYEEKLRFFTNITHEFCTPLTLIYGPCERILAHTSADDYIQRYVRLIRSNAERLNGLIQELIEFRRIESGHTRRNVCMVEAGELAAEMMASFEVIAEQNGVMLETDIDRNALWSSDPKCLRKVFSNLVSNALKYTPEGGTVRAVLRIEDEQLFISVYNTGKGIRPEERAKLFNRYELLDNFEHNATKGLSSRHGLGLAICRSMVELLEGSIEVESEPGSYARFIVRLPRLTVDTSTAETVEQLHADASRPADAAARPASEAVQMPPQCTDKEAPSILIVDDNHEILMLLADSLSDYRVTTADNAADALAVVHDRTPDLILTDVMMPGTDGLSLTRTIKQDRHTAHIPLIIISAKVSADERAEGIDAGAEAYITKPVNISYLRAVVNRLLANRRALRDYFTSSASAYTYASGKLMSNEDKELLTRIAEFVDSRIADPELTPELLAEHVQMSVRALYRRLKELDQLPPADFIKSQRLAFAARMLATTQLTVGEIIYRCGFNNRSHFYREFAKLYGVTPTSYRDAAKEQGEAPSVA